MGNSVSPSIYQPTHSSDFARGVPFAAVWAGVSPCSYHSDDLLVFDLKVTFLSKRKQIIHTDYG